MDMRSHSNRSESPILKRISESFDYNYDSISAISGSTIADSEYVAQQIRNYEKLHSSSDTSINSSKPTVYNLRIDKVVIDGANKTKDADKGAIDVDKIFTNFTKSKDTFRKETKLDYIRQLLSRRKVHVPLALVLIICFGLSIILPVIYLKEPIDENTQTTTKDEGSTSPPSESTEYPPNTSPTQTTSNDGTTTPVPPPSLYYSRNVWDSDGFGLQGKHKQLTPINKLILINLEMDFCNDKQGCLDLIVDLQQRFYPEHDDIIVNFVSNFNGTIFEGRGFSREGESTFDSYHTSYNRNAISFGFMVLPNVALPNELQQTELCKFIEKAKSLGHLSENLKVFLHQSIVSTGSSNDYLEYLSCDFFNFTIVPNIIKRNDWMTDDIPEEKNIITRRKVTNVIIASRSTNCDSIDICKIWLNELQQLEDLQFNFAIGGSDLIFEILNFDVAPNSNLTDSLLVLVSSTSVPENVMENLSKLIRFGHDLEKIVDDFKLLVENQVSGDKELPENSLMDLIRSHPNYEENYESTCDGFCSLTCS